MNADIAATPAQTLAAAVNGTATVTIRGNGHPVLVRIPEHQLAQLDALAMLIGKSRPGIVVHLIEVALSEVVGYLDKETLERFNTETYNNLKSIRACPLGSTEPLSV